MNLTRIGLVVGIVFGAFGAELLVPRNLQSQDAPLPRGRLRSWKAKEGSFTTEAAFVEKRGDDVVLERKDGKIITVPLDKLSFNDRAYVSDWIKRAAVAQLPAKPMAGTPAAGKPPGPPTPETSTSGKFDVQETLKRWDQEFEPLQLEPIAQWKLERKPDHFEFAAGGDLLYVVFFADAKHLLYQAKDGKLLATIEYGAAPLTAAAISPDGKHLVATLGDKGCGVYEVAAKKEVYVHPQMGGVASMHVTTSGKTFLVAAQPQGTFFRYPLLGGDGSFARAPKDAPAKLPPAARTEIASSADGTHLLIAYPYEVGGILVLEFNADGSPKDHRPVGLQAVGNGPLAIGNRMCGFSLKPGQLFWMRIFGKAAGTPLLPYRLAAPVYPQVFVSPDDNFSAIFEPEPGHLTFQHVTSTGATCYQFYDSFRPELVRLSWAQERLALLDAEGRVEVSRFRGYHSATERIDADVHSWLENKQDERLEQMALALEQDCNPLAGLMPANPKYAYFYAQLTNRKGLRTADAANPHLISWLERNPQSRLARYLRAEQATVAAWRARGDGFADTVTEEGWRVFHAKLKEAEVELDSLAKEPAIPPVAYPVIFDVAKGQQWEAAKVAPFVDRLLKECPENFAAHASYAESILPRWGGEVEDCKKYAERVAKEKPGRIGEAAYAAICLRLHNFHAQGIFEELGFDRERAQMGLTHLFRNNLDTPLYRQSALLLAVLAGDGTKARHWKSEIIKNNNGWVDGVMKEEFFHRIMSALK